jgi:hypothetical protein
MFDDVQVSLSNDLIDFQPTAVEEYLQFVSSNGPRGLTGSRSILTWHVLDRTVVVSDVGADFFFFLFSLYVRNSHVIQFRSWSVGLVLSPKQSAFF